MSFCQWVCNCYLGCDLAVVMINLKDGVYFAHRRCQVEAVYLLKAQLTTLNENKFVVKHSDRLTILLLSQWYMFTDSHLECLRLEIIVDFNLLLFWSKGLLLSINLLLF